MGDTPEGAVKKDVRTYLDALGAYTFMPVQMGYGTRTIDYLCCVPAIITPSMVGRTMGCFVGIEAKAVGKYPTKFQDITMRAQHDAGAIVVLAWSAADVQRALVEAGLR